MKKATPRKGFDPEGYIDFARKKVNLGKYAHIPYPHDVIIRNMEEREVELAIDGYNRKMEQKMREIEEAEMLSSSDEEPSSEKNLIVK